VLHRGVLATSAVVHVAVLGALFFVRGGRTVMLPGPDVVQVALIGEPAPAPPPAPEPVVRPTDTVTPDEDQGVQIQKERPKPKPVVKQQPQPDKPQPAPPKVADPVPSPPNPVPSNVRPQLEFAPVGEGVSGGVATDDPNFEFAYYLQMVRSQIAHNWTPPDGAGSGAKVVLHFRVARGGGISQLRLETGSGNPIFDQSALRAVVITQTLPPLPLGYAGADLGIHLGFQYTGP
jgi:TonB family protein